ncbi:MAG: efflux RND transporter periplasmic adaptor subunit [Planctomycetales bacterium]|nr:efflux RND transporter periplasmic adaptor subunit [Planctomycetales bacterium]
MNCRNPSVAGLRLAFPLVLCTLVAGRLPAQKSLPPVEVATVVESEVHTGYRVVGTVNPLRRSTIGSAVAGRVVEFCVKQGDPVLAGQPLARLRTETLEIELAAAWAELELTRQQLAELQNGSRPEEIAEAEANALGAEAAKENAAAQLRRMQSLVSSRAATDADLEDAHERARLTQFAFAAADALRQRIKAGPRKEQIAQAAARVELQGHNVALLTDRIKKHTMLAPFDGFVSAEFTELGAWIGSGDAVAEVIQLDEVQVQAPVPGEHATKLRLGDTIRVEFPDLPDYLLTGTIERIVPVAEARARTFPVMIRLKNQIRDGLPLLMAGMLARVELPAGRQRVLPLVPKDALVLNESQRAVFVFESGSDEASGSVRRVPVELGVAVGGMIQVTGDIRAGQQVVVVGNERLLPGANVTVTKRAESQIPAG